MRLGALLLASTLVSSAVASFSCTQADLKASVPGLHFSCPAGTLCVLDLSAKGITQLDSTVLAACNATLTPAQKANDESSPLGTIGSVAPGAFEDAAALGFTAIHILTLINNRIQSLPRGAFRGLGFLEWLLLDENRLSTLDPRWLDGLDALAQLHLGENQLTSLEPSMFDGLPRSVRSILLDLNPLSAIEGRTFANISSQLTYLRLDFTPTLAYVGPGAFDGIRGTGLAPDGSALDMTGSGSSATTCAYNQTTGRVQCRCAADRYAPNYPLGRRLAGGERGEVHLWRTPLTLTLTPNPNP
jgi:hypothetical protein